MNLGGPELLIILVVFVLTGLPLVMWGIIDAASRPDWAWQQAGQTKLLWILLPAITFMALGCVAIPVSLVYLLTIRPKVAQAQQAAGELPR